MVRYGERPGGRREREVDEREFQEANVAKSTDCVTFCVLFPRSL